MPAPNNARKKREPKASRPSRGPTRFPGSTVFCQTLTPPRTHGHLYRVLMGERESPGLVNKYAAWLKTQKMEWPQAAKVKPTKA